MARGKQIIKKISKSTSECLELFIKHCEVKNLTFRTINNYRFECQHFIEWHGKEKGIDDITPCTIEEYISYLQSKEITQTYVATKVRQLRAFFTSVWNENT